MIRGEPNQLGPEVPRGFLTILGGAKLPPEEKGSGRLALAQWVTDPTNPLTARVIVNRVWLWHFGQGIVATPDDFGARGEAPTHPELLDYLTSRFLEGGMAANYVQKFLDHAKLSTTSRYLNVNRDGRRRAASTMISNSIKCWLRIRLMTGSAGPTRY